MRRSTEQEIAAQTLDQTIQVQDTSTGEQQTWTLQEVFDYINEDRSDDWTDYDITDDWREAWDEWVDPECWTVVE